MMINSSIDQDLINIPSPPEILSPITMGTENSSYSETHTSSMPVSRSETSSICSENLMECRVCQQKSIEQAKISNKLKENGENAREY